MVHYIGYSLKWGDEEKESLKKEHYSPDGWLYPEGMIERVKYIDDDVIIFHFPEPMTLDEIKEYDELILDESLGYSLIESDSMKQK